MSVKPEEAHFYTESMSEPAQDVPVSSPAIERAVDLARRGVITHLTIHGERVAAIVPESVIDALRAAEDAEDAAEADTAMDEPGESIPWEQVKAELDLQACPARPHTPLRSGRVPAARCGSSTRLSVRRSPRSSMDSPPIRALLVSQP